MFTQPLDLFLNRERSKAFAKEVIDVASPLLQEEVNYATNMVGRCLYKRPSLKEGNIPPLMLFLHIIEMTDAIESLIKECCPIPAINILRSSFEAVLQLEYMLNQDSEMRAIEFLIKNNIELRKNLRIYDCNTAEGKEYEEICKKSETIDGISRDIDPQLIEKAKEIVEQIVNDLEDDKYVIPVDQLKEDREWYSLYNGPENLKALSILLNKGKDYFDLYKGWSMVAHAQDIQRFITAASNMNQLTIISLRNPEQLSFVSYLAHSFMVDSIRLIARHFLPDEQENVAKWQVENILLQSRKLVDLT